VSPPATQLHPDAATVLRVRPRWLDRFPG
jgi:hypothetical protein